MNRIPTRLRPATLEDCSAIYELHRLAVRYICLKSYNPAILSVWLELVHPEIYQPVIHDDEKPLWIIEYNGIISGFFLLDFQEAQLDALYVNPCVHGHGLGTALLNQAEKVMLAANLSMLKLYASTNSVTFYRLNGYTVLGETVMPLNEQISARCTLMRKFL